MVATTAAAVAPGLVVGMREREGGWCSPSALSLSFSPDTASIVFLSLFSLTVGVQRVDRGVGQRDDRDAVPAHVHRGRRRHCFSCGSFCGGVVKRRLFCSCVKGLVVCLCARAVVPCGPRVGAGVCNRDSMVVSEREKGGDRAAPFYRRRRLSFVACGCRPR